MKVSHVKGATQPNFIEVRQYPNKIVSIQNHLKPIKSDWTIGFWRNKAINKVDNVYQMLADAI